MCIRDSVKGLCGKPLHENELHITICCAKAEPNAQTPSTGNAALDDILAHCTPLCPDENAKIELIFENYLLYQVRNESYCVFDADEVRGGTYLCTFERSKLLDYLPRAIDVHLIPDGTDAPASWKHYGIYTQNQIIDIFGRMGFTLYQGPEVDDDKHVFTMLNFAADHPARDMQDTFFIEKTDSDDVTKNVLLRSHTSNDEAHYMAVSYTHLTLPTSDLV